MTVGKIKRRSAYVSKKKQENNKFQNLIDKKQKSIDELNSKISDLESLKSNLENALNTQKQENNKFQNLIDEKQKSIDELNSKISDLKNNIEKKEKANLKLGNKTIKSELESAEKIDKPKRTRKNTSKSKAKNDSSDSLF